MEQEQTGYIILSLRTGNDDCPIDDPARVCFKLFAALPMMGLGDEIVEAELAFNQGDGTYRPYGPSYR